MQNEVKIRPYELTVNTCRDDKESWIGTLLTLANGRIGVRGVLEILDRKDKAVFMMGLYSNVPIWRREIIVLPSVNSVYLVNPWNPSILSVERKLDMMNGILTTNLKFHGNSKIISYISESAVNRVYKNLYMQRIKVQSNNGEVSITLPIENNLNPFLYGYTYTEHLYRTSINFKDNEIVANYKVRDSNDAVSIRMIIKPRTTCEINYFVTRESAGLALTGENIEVERYVFINRGKEENLNLNKISELDWNKTIEEHSEAWRNLWGKIGLEIDGDEYLAGALTFYTYHLLQLIDEDADELMIPARGLHGVGYRGHVFWDTDVYLLPFMVFLFPEVMRKILKFRCRTLKSALEYAVKTGFKGARYPWEADDAGAESTPRYYPVNLSECKCVDIVTGEQELHITGGVAFALDFYYTVTGDKEFFKQCGLKMLVEIARYWTSRAEYDSVKKLYVIKNVIGPDEYHVGVDNNYYTNYLAKYALKKAAKYVFDSLKDPDLKQVLVELGVSDEEAEKWNNIADLMYTGKIIDDIIEQFEGYFNLAEPSISDEKIRRINIERLNEVGRTKLIKQADVVLTLVLQELIEGVDPKILRKNYEYYLKYTTHESSLSLPIYATAGFIIDDQNAVEMFKTALKTDLENLYNNTHEGFHVATAGGLWYAILLGIMGIRIRGGKLIVSPKKVNGLKIAISIKYKGDTVRITPRE
jgi:kojibiose phosphorylase